MNNRRSFLLTIAAGLVALGVVIGPAIADELMGTITKVNADAKKVTVVEKGTDKEVEVTVTDSTEYVTGKGSSPLDLNKLSRNLEKAKEKGKKGINVTVTHEKGVASKINAAGKKKAD